MLSDFIYNLDEWDSVVTCFFIDTAHNVIEYVEKIWSILKPNGYWINFGPLLYHFADTPNEQSIELSYDQLKHVIKTLGFKFLVSRYSSNFVILFKINYFNFFFVIFRRKISTCHRLIWRIQNQCSNTAMSVYSL